jgi:hypothetical protein
VTNQPKKRGGWHNPASAANGAKARRQGRPRLIAIKIKADDAPALLDWLNANEPPTDSPARRGWEQMLAAVWTEVAKAAK